VQAVRQGTSISNQELTVDLRHRFRIVWRDVEGLNPQKADSKLAIHPISFCSAFDHKVRAPLCVPSKVFAGGAGFESQQQQSLLLLLVNFWGRAPWGVVSLMFMSSLKE